MTTIELLLAGLIIGLALVSIQLYVLTRRIAFLGWACKEQHKLLLAMVGVQTAWASFLSLLNNGTKEQSNETKQDN